MAGVWVGLGKVLGPPPCIPTDVVNAAYQAIEPYADSSVEPGSADYTLAECHQLTDTSYRCMSQVRQKAGAPLMSIQLDVEGYESGRAVVSNLSRSRVPR